MGQPTQLTERWWALFTQGKLDDASELSAPDLHFRGPGVEFSGRDAVKSYLQGFLDGFADIRPHVRTTVEQGDQVFVELEITARDKASGKAMKWFSTDHVKVANGKIAAWSAYWDRIGFATKGAV